MANARRKAVSIDSFKKRLEKSIDFDLGDGEYLPLRAPDVVTMLRIKREFAKLSNSKKKDDQTALVESAGMCLHACLPDDLKATRAECSAFIMVHGGEIGPLAIEVLRLCGFGAYADRMAEIAKRAEERMNAEQEIAETAGEAVNPT